MTVVRPPRKLRALCDQLRHEFDPLLLPAYEQFPNNTAQVDAIRAQAAVFSLDWPATTELSRRAVTASDEWYSGNFLVGNLAALTFTAIRTDARADAKAWLLRWLEERLAVPGLPPHRMATLRRLVDIQQLAMSGQPTGLTLWTSSLSPKPLETFVDQLAKYREGTDPDSADGIEYMLHFIAIDGAPEDFLALYSRIADEPTVAYSHHITASRILAAGGDNLEAQAALRRVRSTRGWIIESTDILPMTLFEQFDLHPLLTDELLISIRDDR